ncbi:MAG: hypothetical protein HQL32_16165 [Planctomycetes bacterium]|nr:hypothetical protein [Planctomycetota bacterium]
MVHIVGGSIAALLGILGIIQWWNNFGDVLRGSIPLLLLVGGFVAVSAGLQMKKEAGDSE